MKCHFSLKSPSSVCHKPIGESSAVFTSSLHVELGFCFFATTSDPFMILSDSLMTLKSKALTKIKLRRIPEHSKVDKVAT